MIKLSQQQADKLRGDGGPYSEVNIKIEDRLVDNYSSRQFVSVYANINPLTIEIAKQNIHSFNKHIQQLLDTAQYQGQEHGYVIYNFKEQVDFEDISKITSVLKRAQKSKQELTNHVIQLHYFVMDLLGIKYKEVKI